MKYRIMYNGDNYIIQFKKLLSWDVLTRESAWGEIIKLFISEKECENYMRINYGNFAERIREYRTV